MTQPLNNYSSEQFAQREMRNTDYLAFRAVAESGQMRNMHVLDVGCGAGRSTRFLQALGNQVVGVDCNTKMVTKASSQDPDSSYLTVERDSTSLPFEDHTFAGLFSSWMLLEQGSSAQISALLKECVRVLKPDGLGIFVTNTADFYRGDWLSCGIDFPENKPPLRSGQVVRALLLPEEIAVTDYFWSDADYRRFFTDAGFSIHNHELPLGRAEDELPWKDETRLAPYSVYYLRINKAK